MFNTDVFLSYQWGSLDPLVNYSFHDPRNMTILIMIKWLKKNLVNVSSMTGFSEMHQSRDFLSKNEKI